MIKGQLYFSFRTNTKDGDKLFTVTGDLLVDKNAPIHAGRTYTINDIVALVTADKRTTIIPLVEVQDVSHPMEEQSDDLIK